MELFAECGASIPAGELQRQIRIDNLPEWCSAIHGVTGGGEERAEIDSVWGRVRIRREVIADGVRFTLPTSDIALQWTITSRHGGGGVVIHFTANRERLAAEQMAQIELCAERWRSGIEGWRERRAAQTRVGGVCPPSYGGFG